MTFNSTFARRFSLAVALAAGAAFVPATAHAGFLDDLFGGGVQQQAPVQPTPDAGGYSYDRPSYGSAPASPKRHVKKKVAVVDKPVLQKTTDIMSDKTLRPGDAVMMKSGVHIFNGESDSHHDSSDFVGLDSARHVAKTEKVQLVAMDVAHRDPMDYAASTTTMLEGRSVGGRPINDGFKITDAKGRSIRYVGP